MYIFLDTAVELSFADYSIEIPDNSAVDTYVTHIRIEDQDEGDFIENIKQDYNNQYFYFDTKLSKYTTIFFLQISLHHKQIEIH